MCFREKQEPSVTNLFEENKSIKLQTLVAFELMNLKWMEIIVKRHSKAFRTVNENRPTWNIYTATIMSYEASVRSYSARGKALAAFQGQYRPGVNGKG